MEQYTGLAIVVLIALGLVLLWLAICLFAAGIVGAIQLLRLAAEGGFIGVAAYIAFWIFAFPAMLVISIVVGILKRRHDKLEKTSRRGR